MKIDRTKKIKLFGCPLDVDEKEFSVQEKISQFGLSHREKDPFERVLEELRKQTPEGQWESLGSLDVPSWLLPIPPEDVRNRMTVEQFIEFIDQDGCRSFASKVGDFVRTHVLPDIPCMIAVDHSMTGGVIQALTDHYDDDVAVVIFDSHSDAVPMSALAGAIQFDAETNPNSVHDRNDPYLYNRTESYNAGSFVHFLLSEEIVAPENLYLIGISDYPPKHAFRMKDKRIVNFTRAYSRLKNDGVKIATKQDCLSNPNKLKTLFRRIDAPYLYVSVDMDIGAIAAVEGVRFKDWEGLAEGHIFRIVELLLSQCPSDVELVGLDVTEFNPRVAGMQPRGEPPGVLEPTYRIAANLIKNIAFRTQNH